MAEFTVYLAGPINGCSYEGAVDWREKLARCLPQAIRVLSPMRDKDALVGETLLSGDYSHRSRLCTPQAIVTRDRHDVKRADMIVVVYPDDRCDSFGTAVEIGWATAQLKPVVICAPKTNRVCQHPFVAGLGIPVVHDTRALLDFICTVGGM